MKNVKFENGIELFNPYRARCEEVVASVKSVKIKNINDDDGIAKLKEMKKPLQDLRIEIKKIGLDERSVANDYAKQIIGLEKDLLEIIVPVEDQMKKTLADIAEKKKMKEREILLPMREEMMLKIDVKTSKKELLSMDEKEFTSFYTEKKDEYDTEQKRIQDEKDAEIARKAEIAEVKAQATKDAQERAERESSEREAQILAEAEAEKQALIDEQKKAEQDAEIEKKRIIQEQNDKEAQIKKDEEIATQKAIVESEKLRKNKQHAEWLKKHNYNTDDFRIEREDNTFTMFKKIDDITIE